MKKRFLGFLFFPCIFSCSDPQGSGPENNHSQEQQADDIKEKDQFDACDAAIALPECASLSPATVHCHVIDIAGNKHKKSYDLEAGQYCKAELHAKAQMMDEACKNSYLIRSEDDISCQLESQGLVTLDPNGSHSKIAVSQYFAIPSRGHSQYFFNFQDQPFVLHFLETDAGFKLHLNEFANSTHEERNRWVNNQHSDGIYTNPAELTESHDLQESLSVQLLNEVKDEEDQGYRCQVAKLSLSTLAATVTDNLQILALEATEIEDNRGCTKI